MQRCTRLLSAGLALLAVAGRADWWAEDPDRSADRLLALGRAAVTAQEWDRAEDFASRLIADEHRDRGRLLRGESLFQQHRPESAFEALNKVRGVEFRVDAARIQGRCLVELGNEREADRILRYVLQERPDDADAYRGLAAVAYNQGNWVQAEEYLKKVIDLAPGDGRPLWTLGLIHQDLALHPQAETYFRDALAHDLPGDMPGAVRADLAVSLAAQNRFAEALNELAEAQLPVFTPVQGRMQVDCLRSVGRVDEALARADAILRDIPGDPGVIAEKGLCMLDKRRATDAVALLERALAVDPHDRRARDGLRRAYLAAGRSADAADQPGKLAETDALYANLTKLTQEAMEKPWDASVRNKLAETCEKLRKPDLAAMWRKAARMSEAR